MPGGGQEPNEPIDQTIRRESLEEISAEVMDKHQKVIMDQAENRMHTQKALIALMLGL